MKLRDNKWGFDLKEDNPFRIFRVLRHIAIEKIGEEGILDLSRGDPGYGFSPSVRGTEFYAFLLETNTIFNYAGEHFVSDNKDDFDTLWGKIQAHARKIYSAKKAEKLIEDFYFFLTRVQKYSKEQGLDWDKKQIIFEMFKYSVLSGGSYLDPQGETLIRAIIADHYNQKLDLKIDYQDLIFIQGVSHGIGTVFKTFNDEKIGYLKKGDTIMMFSPSYAPYNMSAEHRGLNVYPVPVDSSTGQIENFDEYLENAPENTKMICLIDPNNPTGFSFSDEITKKIAEFAEAKDILIVSDEVYSDFFFERKSNILKYARNRSIVIGGRSKIERSTGLRFGEFIITKEANEYISKTLLRGKLNGSKDLKTLLVCAKGPGGINGEFQHTTFVTGPSQFLGASHVLFGSEDRDEYLRRIRVNMENFYEILGMKYNKNLYYSNFSMLAIPGNTRTDLPPEQIFFDLAERGVVLIPSNRFYSEKERNEKDYRLMARASLPNLTFSKLQEAAKVIKKYMTE